MPCIPQKTLSQIIESGNHYLVTAKENQPKLFAQLQTQFEQAQENQMDRNIEVEYTRDREVERSVSVLERPSTIAQQWVGIERIARVERFGTRAGGPFDETVFYIGSLRENAAEFAQCIRSHWYIENCLHWPKDVVLKKDASPYCDGHALINFSIIRTIAMNIFRREGFSSITKGIRYLAHDIHRLFFFLQ